MDTLDTRLEAFRDYVADPTVDEARAVAARSWQPRRRGVHWRLLVPAAGVMFAGVLLALLVSREDRDHVVPGTRSTPTVRTDVREQVVPLIVRTDVRTGTASDRSVPGPSTSTATPARDRGDTTPRSSTTTTRPGSSGGTTSTPGSAASSSGGSAVRSCGEIVVEPSDGSTGLIYAIRDVRGMECTDAERITRLAATSGPLPSGWQCDADTCWQGGDLAEAFRRFTYLFGGDAG